MARAAPEPIQSLNRAIEIVGSQTAFGRLLSVSQMSVSRWSRGVVAFPPEHVLTVERETGISRHDLRPDVYGPASAATAQPPHPGAPDDLERAR
jgi:DNA-binding transcriptional regulator YdaS (Cro superfamily)